MKRFLALSFALAFVSPALAQDADKLLMSASDALSAGKKEEALELASKAVAADAKSVPALIFRANLYEHLDRYLDSVLDHTRIVELEPTRAIAYQARGLVQFKAGKVKESIADFDKYIELQPKAKISHWQRGISYYYAGQYDDGTKQFEGYQDFDSNDVENAVWRFMCMTRSVGIEKARKAILKIGDDRRVPMRQVYDLYKGDLKPDDVFTATKAGNPTPAQLSQRLFYAHLYVGIYHDLLGDKQKAFDHLQKATEDHRIGHYMWDVARVHRDIMKKAK
jgi:lipoprotein NlpI